MALEAGGWDVFGDANPGTSVPEYAGMGKSDVVSTPFMNYDQPAHQEGVETVQSFLM